MIFGEIIGSCSVFSPATTGIVFEESSDLVTDNPFPAANHPNCKTVAGDRECCLFRVYCVEAWKCGSVEVYFVEVYCVEVLFGGARSRGLLHGHGRSLNTFPGFN